jgi:hypothetical protein
MKNEEVRSENYEFFILTSHFRIGGWGAIVGMPDGALFTATLFHKIIPQTLLTMPPNAEFDSPWKTMIELYFRAFIAIRSDL